MLVRDLIDSPGGYGVDIGSYNGISGDLVIREAHTVYYDKPNQSSPFSATQIVSDNGLALDWCPMGAFVDWDDDGDQDYLLYENLHESLVLVENDDGLEVGHTLVSIDFGHSNERIEVLKLDGDIHLYGGDDIVYYSKNSATTTDTSFSVSGYGYAIGQFDANRDDQEMLLFDGDVSVQKNPPDFADEIPTNLWQFALLDDRDVTGDGIDDFLARDSFTGQAVAFYSTETGFEPVLLPTSGFSVQQAKFVFFDASGRHQIVVKCRDLNSSDFSFQVFGY